MSTTVMPQKSRLLFAVPVAALIICLLDHRFGLDIEWFRQINSFCQLFPDALWSELTLLGNGWICFALAFPLIVLAPRLLYSGLIAGGLTAILSNVLKKIAHTPRPASVLDLHSFHVIGHPLFQGSMPSGHTMTAFGCAAALYFSIAREQRRPISCFFFLAAAVGLSRIAIGAHWPQDVMVGMGVGLFCGLYASRLARRIPARYLCVNAWPAYIPYLGSAAGMYALLFTHSVDPTGNMSMPRVAATVIVLTWLAIARRMLKARERQQYTAL